MNAAHIAHGRIGGTIACVLAHGNHFGVTPLKAWEVLTGRADPEDLTWKLPVQIGIVTEAINALFFTHKSGIVVDRGDESCRRFHCEEIVGPNGHQILNVHPEHDWLTAQLDGVTVLHHDEGGHGIFEAKHTSEHSSLERQLESYYAQLQHYMLVTGARYAYLSCLFGNSRIEYQRVERDERWIEAMLPRYRAFWRAVVQGVAPASDGCAPIKPEVVVGKEKDMSQNNAWSDCEVTYQGTQKAAEAFKMAEKELKGMAPADCQRTFGKQLEVRRDRAGKARIMPIASDG